MVMKKPASFLLITLFLSSIYAQKPDDPLKNKSSLKVNEQIVPDKTDRNNNFYDNEETFILPLNDLYIEGEVENPGKVDFSKLTKHSIIVKETLLKDDGTDAFVGAYRYDGYSLFDILNDRILAKRNADEFKPIIDLYVEIENPKGEKVVVSWGEIYYPNFLHNTLIATEVMRIVPSKTKNLWPLPAESKLVVASDLITERNISNPVKITVRSYSRSIPVDRDIEPLYSSEIRIYSGDKLVETIKESPKLQPETVHTIFYGRGRGIHSTQPFTGYYLKEIIRNYFTTDRKNLKQGMLAIAGRDGYRSVFTFSEIANRNDQAEILLVPCKEEKDGGRFRIFPSCDFFSDRAVKAVSEMYFTW
jgi:hypothetical protein